MKYPSKYIHLCISLFVFTTHLQKNKTQNKLKIALRDQEQHITPQQNTDREQCLEQKLLRGGRAKGAASFLYNAAQTFKRTQSADFSIYCFTFLSRINSIAVLKDAIVRQSKKSWLCATILPTRSTKIRELLEGLFLEYHEVVFLTNGIRRIC